MNVSSCSAQLLGRVLRLVQPPPQPLDDRVVGRQQALVLVAEVLVEAAPGDARARDQLGDGRRDVAVLVHAFDHRLVQPLALVRGDLLARERLRTARQGRAGAAIVPVRIIGVLVLAPRARLSSAPGFAPAPCAASRSRARVGLLAGAALPPAGTHGLLDPCQ